MTYTITWYREVLECGDWREQGWRIRFRWSPETRASRHAPAEGGEVEFIAVWQISLADDERTAITGEMDVDAWASAYHVTEAELRAAEQVCLDHAAEDDSHLPEWDKYEAGERLA